MFERRGSTRARLLSMLVAAAFTMTGLATTALADPGQPVLGVVVSSDQHAGGAPIQWDRVAATGARVAVIEATDGGRYRNPWFSTDYSAARTAGLVRGGYAVGRPALPLVTSATQQADYYLARLRGFSLAQTLPPMLDLQTTGNLKQGQLITWAQTFLLRVEQATGRVPILHTYGYFWTSALGSPDAFSRYSVWTSTGVSSFPGVSTPVQTLAINTDDAHWSAWQNGTEPAPWTDSVPGAPGVVGARAYDSSALVSWLPGDTGSSALTGYQVLAEPGDITTTLTGDVTQAAIRGLTNGTAYTFTVTATNALGAGAASPSTAAVTPDATLGAVPPLTTTPPQHSNYTTTNCMAPESLVRNTAWTRTQPTAGVTLQEGRHRDSRGRVQMHVLRVDLTNPHVRLAPLMAHVSDHRRLSVLASQRNLVAATNAGYFDLGSGAPIGPLVLGGNPFFGPGITSAVVGLGPDGRMSTAGVAASGTVSGPQDVLPLAGWNAAQPAEGVNAYSARWGSRAVPMPRDALSRRVAGGVVTSAVGRSKVAPAQGYLLVARGPVAAGWLRSLQMGDPVNVRVALTSTSRSPFSRYAGSPVTTYWIACVYARSASSMNSDWTPWELNAAFAGWSVPGPAFLELNAADAYDVATIAA